MLDMIVGLDVVLANGSFVHASAASYPDIYWVHKSSLFTSSTLAKRTLGSSRRR